jgi:hypothetical protein
VANKKRGIHMQQVQYMTEATIGDRFLSVFQFLTEEFGYEVAGTTSVRDVYQEIVFGKTGQVISVSYENADDDLQVVLFKVKDGKLPDFDDETHTLHLTDMTDDVLARLTPGQIQEYKKWFSDINSETRLDKQLQESAAWLRLCLRHAHLTPLMQ